MGIYDLPAIIDRALSTTGQKKVHHVGYDLAGSKILVLLSMRPEYNAKVKLSSLMGPKVYGNNMRSPVRLLGGPVAFESVCNTANQFQNMNILKFVRYEY